MILILVLVVIILVFVYSYVKLKYFTLHGPLPGLQPQFLFGNMLQTGMLTRNEPAFRVGQQLQRQFGDVFQFWFGPSRSILVCGADDVQHVFTHRHIYDQGDIHINKFRLFFHNALVCMKGAEFKRHASCTLPLFRRGKAIKHLDLFIVCTDRLLLDQWRSFKPGYMHTDIVQQSKRCILAIFGIMAFDYDLDLPTDNELHRALHDFSTMVGMLLNMPEFIIKIYLKFSSKYRQAVATIEQYLYRILEEEQSRNQESINKQKQTSLIASLVSALQKDEMEESMKPENEKRGLSRKEVLHEMLFFLVGSYDASSAALSWFIHLVSKHPRVQAKIKAELPDNTNQHFTIEQLDSFVYLDAVVREVLRFASPFDGTIRTLTADDCLPASQAQLYKGDQVVIPFYNLARDPRYWKIDPELFYPERFLDDDADKNHHPYAFLPFGGGHRQCPGQELALIELKTIAARLMQHVTFGDGGPDVNAGEHQQKSTSIFPKYVGVAILFD